MECGPNKGKMRKYFHCSISHRFYPENVATQRGILIAIINELTISEFIFTPYEQPIENGDDLSLHF